MFEFTEDVQWILGRPNYACHDIAKILRISGIEIDTKAEAEQARVIYWMLEMQEKHGDDWREEANKELETILKPHDQA